MITRVRYGAAVAWRVIKHVRRQKQPPAEEVVAVAVEVVWSVAVEVVASAVVVDGGCCC